jgi:glucose/mannose-6-phosphate isomerase
VSDRQYLDTLGMWEATTGFPEQGRAAMALATQALEASALPPPEQIHSVAIFGMGTAATAAEAVAAYAASRAPVPVWIGNGYEAPSFVGPGTLVFALSGSGATEETHAAAAAAVAQGARVVVVSAPGPLLELAADSALPLFEIPAGLPASRTTLAFLTVPVLLTLARAGIVPDVAPMLDEALTFVARRRDVLLTPGSAPEEMARRIGRTIPLVYGSSGVAAVAARRWKTQINENAKTPAFFAVQPELSHNEVAGWGQHGDVTRQVLSLVTLRHAGEHPQVSRRFALVVEATDEVMANVLPVWTEGENDLARFFDLALFGDLVSLHMAGRERIDPGPVPARSIVESALRS